MGDPLHEDSAHDMGVYSFMLQELIADEMDRMAGGGSDDSTVVADSFRSDYAVRGYYGNLRDNEE